MKSLFVFLLLLPIAFAGCTSDGGHDDDRDDGMDDGMGDGGEAGTMPAGESNAQTHHIRIANFAFESASLAITQGDTVMWTNKDSASHTVDSTDGTGTLDSENLANGDTFSFTFDDAGTFAYRCDIHPSMTGEIIVESLAAS